jgi:hypothetical protein
MKIGNVVIDRVGQTMLALMLAFTLTAWSCNTNWLTTVEADIPVIAQEAENILTLVDPGDAQLAQTVGNAAVAGVKLVSDAVAAYNQNPNASTLQNVVAALNSVATDLPSTLNSVAGQFLNPTDLLIVTAAVDAIVTTLDIIASQISPTTVSTAAKLRLSKAKSKGLPTEKIPTAAQLKAQWNQNVCGISQAHCHPF